MAEWFDKLPGSDLGQSQADPHMVPRSSGSARSRGHDHDGLVYVLDGPVWCMECVIDKVFLWFSRRE